MKPINGMRDNHATMCREYYVDGKVEHSITAEFISLKSNASLNLPKWGMYKDLHGGAGRNQGRRAIKTGEPTVTMSIRMTKGQRDKLVALGGAEWVRGKIDSARKPK